MKGKMKYIIAAILLVAGLGIAFVGFAIGGFDIKRISTVPPYEQRMYMEKETVNAIHLNDENVRVVFSSSTEDYVRVDYFENKNETYAIENVNGKLSITKEIKGRLGQTFFAIDFTTEDIRIVITVPESFRGDVFLKTSNSSVELSDLIADNVRVDTSNGRINVKKTDVLGILELSTSNASIFTEQVMVSDSAVLHSSNGKISVEHSDFSGKVVGITSNAGFNFKEVSAESYDLKTSNGKISLQDVMAKENILLKTSNSSIEVMAVEVGESLVCTTSNGRISGSVVGEMSDFSIFSKTSNGNNNLPGETKDGEKIAEFKTSNANIEIIFE